MRLTSRHHAPMLALLLALLTAAAWAAPALQRVPANNADYVYAGRVDFANPAAPVFYWAGNAATIGFTGRALGVVLDAPADGIYFDVIIDGAGATRHVIRARKGRHTYFIAGDLADTRHTVEVFRRVDPTYPGVAFDGIRIATGSTVFRPAQKTRLKIVFYGDSITAGYGVLDPTRKHEGRAAYMDNYVAYDAVAARTLDADYRAIALSGIGILKSWFPLTMPQLYDRLAPRDLASRWNFTRWTPDIVVVNLLQNDSWLLPREPHPPTPAAIVAAYAGFIRTLRAHYPRAAFVCMLGNMDVTANSSPWPGYVRTAVRQLRAGGERNVHVLIVPYKGTPGHPDVAEQATMARALVAKIKAIEAGAAAEAQP